MGASSRKLIEAEAHTHGVLCLKCTSQHDPKAVVPPPPMNSSTSRVRKPRFVGHQLMSAGPWLTYSGHTNRVMNRANQEEWWNLVRERDSPEPTKRSVVCLLFLSILGPCSSPIPDSLASWGWGVDGGRLFL